MSGGGSLSHMLSSSDLTFATDTRNAAFAVPSLCQRLQRRACPFGFSSGGSSVWRVNRGRRMRRSSSCPCHVAGFGRHTAISLLLSSGCDARNGKTPLSAKEDRGVLVSESRRSRRQPPRASILQGAPTQVGVEFALSIVTE